MRNSQEHRARTRRSGPTLLVLLVCASLLAAGCESSAPSPSAAATAQGQQTSAPPSTAASTPAPVTAPPSSGIALRGNLPGSLGSLAAWGNLVVANVWADYRAPGPDDGFVVVDVSDPANPRQLARFRCAASYGDISIWEDVVVLSQYDARHGPDCEAPAAAFTDADAFAGLRVVSIADPANPVLLASVPTGAPGGSTPGVYGSHTNTIVPDLEHRDANGRAAPRLLVYAAMYYHPRIKPSASIVEVLLDDPASAHVIGAIDNDEALGCHDMTVFLPRSLMACSAYEAGVVLFDISDPEHPARVGRLIDPTISKNGESHHSTAFSNDGMTLLINAEIYTDVGVAPCSGGTTSDRGQLWFYDVSVPSSPDRKGSFQLPRPNRAHACYPHESNVIPVSGDRDLAVTGWFGGGVDIVDFTDPANPAEIAWWSTDGPDGGHSFAYAGYWYNGAIYAGNLALLDIDVPPSNRGLDILAVDPALVPDAVTLPGLNAQTQLALPTP